MYRFKPTVEYIPQKRLERVMQRASFQSYQSDLDRVEEDCWDFSGLSEVVSDLLCLLTQQERYVVQLVFWEGLNLAEVSFSTRMKPKRVRELYNSALDKMKAALSDSQGRQSV